MRILVYDGDCPFCRGASATLLRWLSLPDATRRPLSSFRGEALAQLTAAGANEALAVLDTGSGEIRTGVAGLIRLARGTRLGLLAGAASLPPLRLLLSALYRFVARNRRALFGPRGRAARGACDCPIR